MIGKIAFLIAVGWTVWGLTLMYRNNKDRNIKPKEMWSYVIFTLALVVGVIVVSALKL